jgi:benzoyl-CoA-dihydrodiol lyase
VRERAAAAAAASPRPRAATGITLDPLNRRESPDGLEYDHVTAAVDRQRGVVEIRILGPREPAPADVAAIHAQGARGWLLALTRELDDMVLRLRTNEPTVGTWVFRSAGDPAAVLAHEQAHTADDWLCNEIRHYLKRTLKRLDVTSRSLICLIEPGSCFAGALLDLALACDRQYMLDGPPPADETSDERATIELSGWNFGPLPMGNGLSRLESRFYGDAAALERVRGAVDRPLSAPEALDLGLVTAAPDDLDWDDEVRIAIEERASLSPDALTGMEANHRFVGPETVETKIFGRLTAWQNWIFNRPNAAGPDGALRMYGTGRKAEFDRERV